MLKIMQDMTLGISELISIFTLVITLLGFFITYKQMKKEYKLAIINEKNINATNEMKEALNCAYDLLWSYMRLNAYNNKSEIKKVNEIRNKLSGMVIKFATEKTVKIWGYFENNLLAVNDKDNPGDFVIHENANHYVIAVLVLIIAQIKNDIYGLEISPKYILLSIFGCDIISKGEFLKNEIEYNNEIVTKLGLDDFLIIEIDEKNIWK